MAKSLRSKFKRKVRAIKRVKNAPKELLRLQKVADKEKAQESTLDSEMSAGDAAAASATQMETKKASGFNVDTLKKADGSYPSWLSERKKKNAAKKNKAAKKSKATKAKRTR